MAVSIIFKLPLGFEYLIAKYYDILEHSILLHPFYLDFDHIILLKNKWFNHEKMGELPKNPTKTIV